MILVIIHVIVHCQTTSLNLRSLVGHPEVQKSMFTACLRIKNYIIRRLKLKYQIFSGALELYGTIEAKRVSNILQEISARPT